MPTDEEQKESTEQEPAGPIVVTLNDRQRAEILNLRKLVASQQLALIQAQLNDAVRRNDEITRELLNLRAELEQKYGINLQTHDIRQSDGIVIPKMNGPAVQRMLGQ
jgi:hypothetical protein